jgi:MFS transporter, SP family, galactose:H+ symporter
MTNKSQINGFSLFSSLIAAIGGVLFGYNTSVISGALLFLEKDFQLTLFEQESVVSILLIGALVGAFVGGFVADRFGRKKALHFTLFLFGVGILTLCTSMGFGMLLIGRFVTGLGIGLASLAVPLYIAEISSEKSRGTFVSLNQFGITIGILLAYIVSYIYAEKGEWREMFLFAIFPLLIQLLGLFFIPETPSWLLSRGRGDEAKKIAVKISLEASLEKAGEGNSKGGWKEIFAPSTRRAFFIGIGISVFQQITGINTVIYYAPQIFKLAGFQTAKTAIFATMLVGVVNVAMTAVALWLIDKIGRRPLLIVGLVGMALSLATLGFSIVHLSDDVGIISVIALMVYVAFFAVSLGPCAWLIISEIYPLGIRGRAMGIATFANWTCNYFVSLTFLTLLNDLGISNTFWLYTLICLLGLWFVIRLVPETKGKTFKQIQKFWSR